MDLTLEQFRRSSTRLRRLIEPVEDDYDYLFLDCPPSISLVSEAVFEAADAPGGQVRLTAQSPGGAR